MPELPEAETIARQLHAQLAGRRLSDIWLARQDIVKTPGIDLAKILDGREVVRVYRRAKRVVIELDSTGLLIFGLGMTGRLTVVPAMAEIEKHTHLRIGVAALAAELRFRDPRRFGGIWFCDARDSLQQTHQQSDGLESLGIEPLTCTVRQFGGLLERKRQIKALLMDQRVVAGLGNIYCDEALHAAGIHPLQHAHSLTGAQVTALLKSIKTVLQRAIRSKGSTLMDYRGADGAKGAFQRLHRVYGREGEPCKKCGTAIQRIQAAGRSTHFCPRCQKYKRKRANVHRVQESCSRHNKRSC